MPVLEEVEVVEVPELAPMPPCDLVTQVLNRAVLLINTHGWCQGTARDEYGRICAAEAIYGATAFIVVDRKMRHRLAIEARDKVQRKLGVKRIESWNDAIYQTEEEVIAALLATIDQE